MDWIGAYARPFAAAVLMGVVTLAVYALLHIILRAAGAGLYLRNLVSIPPAIVAAVLTYSFILIRLGAISESDFLHLPKGETMVRILRRLRWM